MKGDSGVSINQLHKGLALAQGCERHVSGLLLLVMLQYFYASLFYALTTALAAGSLAFSVVKRDGLL